MAVPPRRGPVSVRSGRRPGGGGWRGRRPVTRAGARRPRGSGRRRWLGGRRRHRSKGRDRHRYAAGRGMGSPRRHDDVELLSREDVPELARLLFEPGDRLSIGDLPFALGDLLRERRVLRGESAHLGVEVPRLSHLSVYGKCNQPADPRDEDDRDPANRDRAVVAWTWSGTDDTNLFPTLVRRMQRCDAGGAAIGCGPRPVLTSLATVRASLPPIAPASPNRRGRAGRRRPRGHEPRAHGTATRSPWRAPSVPPRD